MMYQNWTVYRILCLHRGVRKAFCGYAGRYWFAEHQGKAIDYQTRPEAESAAKDLPEFFDLFAMSNGTQGVERVKPSHVRLFVD